MTRQLILLRHAKSSWDDMSLSDFDRPLNKRGLRDAPRMGCLMRDSVLLPERVISSDANRARMTAERVAAELDVPAGAIQLDHSLYLASPETLLKALSKVEDQVRSVMLVAHNPGMTDLANRLSDARIDNLPTCGVFVVSSEAAAWGDVGREPARFETFLCPKRNLDPAID